MVPCPRNYYHGHCPRGHVLSMLRYPHIADNNTTGSTAKRVRELAGALCLVHSYRQRAGSAGDRVHYKHDPNPNSIPQRLRRGGWRLRIRKEIQRRVCSAYPLFCNPNQPGLYAEIYLLTAVDPKRINKKQRELFLHKDISLSFPF